MYNSSIASLPLIARGKVRDIYAVGEDKLLLVTSDRLSAYDVILPTPIPHKGEILISLANFWFAKLKHIVPNQLTGIDPETVVAPNERDQVRGRAIVVKKYKVLPIEAVVRGYLEGSGWKEYQESQSVCGVKLPPGLQRASKLPQPIFTPATKAEAGEHDENIDFATTEKIIGAERAAEVRDTAIRLYTEAADFALTKGIIIADTKFEFGVDDKACTASDRRSADAGFVALLAIGDLQGRRIAGEFRQAVHPQLAGQHRFQSQAAGAGCARRNCAKDQRQISRSADAADCKIEIKTPALAHLFEQKCSVSRASARVFERRHCHNGKKPVPSPYGVNFCHGLP